LNGEDQSWPALDQAFDIAGREGGSGYGAQVHGLHVVANEAAKLRPEAQAVRAQFEARCAAVGVTGNLVLETGDVTRKIIERALLTDLVVLNVAHPPGAGLTSLGHGLRSIIWRCARPILAVPGRVTQFHRAVLAYDGSPKSKEALFIAAYLAEIYRTQLTVFSVNDGHRVPANVHDYPRAYLEMHEIDADFEISNGPIGVLNDLVRDRSIDLVLMGGYSMSALEEIVVGSAVNMLLREAMCPLLICR
ncbi:MAG: universal stress protein, partial [Chloroflexi bacterium]|nr:universal stress protein [Chloroflexota bacterium]